jgi:hypothetical protein
VNMHAGITGPRRGASQPALLAVAQTLCAFGVTTLHDGDCIGVDESAYYLARAFGIHVVLHPPVNPKYRAWCGMLENEYDSHNTWWPAKPYHDRDRDVVNESAFLIAVPDVVSVHIKPTGGTGWTIDYARSIGHPMVTIWPNGVATYERWEQINV